MKTIPPPHPHEYSAALTGLRTQARAHGLDLNDLATHTFILHQAEVIAQRAAEIRWLRNIIHKE